MKKGVHPDYHKVLFVDSSTGTEWTSYSTMTSNDNRDIDGQSVPVIKLDGRRMAESAAICEYIEETRPEPALMPADPQARFEVRRLVGWFDDKFHREVTSKLLYERVNKKITGEGYPDSRNVKDGARAIKYHLDYMSGLLDQRRGRRDRRRRAEGWARSGASRRAPSNPRRDWRVSRHRPLSREPGCRSRYRR